MLSIFPSLLSYQELSPFLIRIVLAITIGYFGYKLIASRKQNSDKKLLVLGVVQIILGILVLLGLYTQLAALIIAIILLVKLILKAMNKELLTDGINYYILLLVMAVSLLFTGAGWCGFDLPL